MVILWSLAVTSMVQRLKLPQAKIQKLFEYGTQVHKTILANAIEPHIAQLCKCMHVASFKR